jgi:hypothetical protein
MLRIPTLEPYELKLESEFKGDSISMMREHTNVVLPWALKHCIFLDTALKMAMAREHKDDGHIPKTHAYEWNMASIIDQLKILKPYKEFRAKLHHVRLRRTGQGEDLGHLMTGERAFSYEEMVRTYLYGKLTRECLFAFVAIFEKSYCISNQCTFCNACIQSM